MSTNVSKESKDLPAVACFERFRDQGRRHKVHEILDGSYEPVSFRYRAVITPWSMKGKKVKIEISEYLSFSFAKIVMGAVS